MRIISMHIMKWDPENTLFLASSYELGFVGWFQRSFYKEALNFGVRTITSRVEKGQRIAVKLDDQSKIICYIQVYLDNIACVVVCDEEYPQKVPMVIISEMYKELFRAYTTSQINEIKVDSNLKFEKLDWMIKEYQDYNKADKLAQIEMNLKEIQEISHKILADLLKKGEKLEELMQKSKDMNIATVNLYQKARKTNPSCCILF